jgi:hypothetical protein
MPKKKPPLWIKWTPLQAKVAGLLAAGVSPQDIAKQTGCVESLVTKVKKAMTNPDNPPPTGSFTPLSTPGIGKASQEAQETVVGQFNETAEDEVPEGMVEPEGDGQSGQTPPAEGAKPPDKVAKTASQFKNKQPPPGITSELTLIPVTATIAMTPIMLSARQYCITKLGWRQDMPWENLFDTWITLLFQEHGVILHGWFEVDENGEPLEQLAPEVGGNGNNGTHEEEIDPKILQFAKVFAGEFAKAVKGDGHAG